MPNTCPRCNREYPDNVVVCVGCGVDMITGQSLVTRVEDDNEVPVKGLAEEVELTPARCIMLKVGRYLPGLFFPGPLLLALVAMVVAIGLAGLASFIFALGALMGGVVIAGIALIVYAQGIALLLAGRVMLLPDALVELDATRWGIFFLLVFGPLLLIFSIIVVLAG